MINPLFLAAVFLSFSPISNAAAPAKGVQIKPTAPVSATPASAAPASPATTAPEKALDLVIKPDDSLFAIVTHKTGLAAKLAHNHLVAARQFNASMTAHPKKINEGTFIFKTKVNDLEFDRSDLQKQWFPTIKTLGWLSEPFSPLKDSDRETIRENALAEDQLNAKNFPEIEARIESISDETNTIGEKSFAKKARVAVTIIGKTVKRDLFANISIKDQDVSVEAVGDFKFSEFGIKPYKALMGALGNDDAFNMIVSFRAVKK